MSSAGLIIDTNLLLLLVIGSVDDGKYISSSKRLKSYSEEDYQIVVNYMKLFNSVYITPYIAAEVSNLIDLKGHVRDRVFEAAQILFSEFKQAETNIKIDSDSKWFIIYGLADSSMINLVKDYTLLTNDTRMDPALYEVNHENIVHLNLAKALINDQR